MALDHNKYGNLDNDNPKANLVKAKKKDNGEYIILNKEVYNNNINAYDEQFTKDISLVTAIRE
jgi:hypothetical protein